MCLPGNFFFGNCKNDECVFKKFNILKLRDEHIFNVSIVMFSIIIFKNCATLQSTIDMTYPDHEYKHQKQGLTNRRLPLGPDSEI